MLINPKQVQRRRKKKKTHREKTCSIRTNSPRMQMRSRSKVAAINQFQRCRTLILLYRLHSLRDPRSSLLDQLRFDSELITSLHRDTRAIYLSMPTLEPVTSPGQSKYFSTCTARVCARYIFNSTKLRRINHFFLRLIYDVGASDSYGRIDGMVVAVL